MGFHHTSPLNKYLFHHIDFEVYLETHFFKNRVMGFLIVKCVIVLLITVTTRKIIAITFEFKLKPTMLSAL